MKRPQRRQFQADWTYIGALEGYATELEKVLRAAQIMRPILLKQYGNVPECVLDYCNKSRAAVSNV